MDATGSGDVSIDEKDYFEKDEQDSVVGLTGRTLAFESERMENSR